MRAKCKTISESSDSGIDIDDVKSEFDSKEYETKPEFCAWSPHNGLTDQKIDNYLRTANMFGFKEEQALALLTYHQFSIEKAVTDLPNFILHNNVEWEESEEIQFMKMLRRYGKNFDRVKITGKSTKDIILHYYLCKGKNIHPTRIRTKWGKNITEITKKFKNK